VCPGCSRRYLRRDRHRTLPYQPSRLASKRQITEKRETKEGRTLQAERRLTEDCEVWDDVLDKGDWTLTSSGRTDDEIRTPLITIHRCAPGPAQKVKASTVGRVQEGALGHGYSEDF
jgi:hypothetical protein